MLLYFRKETQLLQIDIQKKSDQLLLAYFLFISDAVVRSFISQVLLGSG
jgi:hypothetical protein